MIFGLPLWGLLATGWSWLRSSRIAQIALLVGLGLAALAFWGSRREARGFARAMVEAALAASERMERNREIHRDIRGWPMSKRAERLRALSRRRAPD